MRVMEKQPGAAQVSEKIRKIVRRIMEGLALSARATAWREGLGWEPGDCRPPGRSHHDP
jgi:hypothetical protein